MEPIAWIEIRTCQQAWPCFEATGWLGKKFLKTNNFYDILQVNHKKHFSQK